MSTGQEIEKPITPGVFDVVSSEVKYAGKIISVRVDQVVMPGGKIAAREAIGHDQAVAVVAIDDQDRVILVSQYRHAMRRRLWELPAGLLDIAGEDPLAAAARELGEEVGVEAEDWQVLVDIVPSPGIMDEGVRVYLARGLKDVGRQGDISDEEADLTIDRVPLTVAVAAAFRGEIVNAHAVAGLLAAQLALQNRVPLRPAADAWDSGPALVRGPDEELSELPALSR